MANLYIDTDTLQSLVTTAAQTNEAITDACTLLNQIVVHNDWQCDERTKINENTVTNRTTALTIQTHAAAFYSAIKQAAELFAEVENKNITRVNGIDEKIGQITSIVQGISGGLSSPDIVAFDDFSSKMEE